MNSAPRRSTLIDLRSWREVNGCPAGTLVELKKNRGCKSLIFATHRAKMIFFLSFVGRLPGAVNTCECAVVAPMMNAIVGGRPERNDGISDKLQALGNLGYSA